MKKILNILSFALLLGGVFQFFGGIFPRLGKNRGRGGFG